MALRGPIAIALPRALPGAPTLPARSASRDDDLGGPPRVQSWSPGSESFDVDPQAPAAALRLRVRLGP